ncbi:PREDICTED: anoctamin-7 [Mesitornis unicolor]|uniref:anoctamin-7 n=1 Tax=Mesitornis unicolor TaxID=54374 RepID=UPI0005289280|nr:PREDICTED: anoctamin-7 [Mesitornis unicolor]
MQWRRTTDDPHCSLVGWDSRGTRYGSLSEEAIEITQPNHAALNQKSPANVFSDGSTRIDFVLVWESVPWEQSGQQDSCESGGSQETSTTTHRTWRKAFLDKLHAAGIHMEKHLVRLEKTLVHYLLLSAPWDLLCYYAEELQLRVPLQALPRQTSPWSASVLRRLGIPNLVAQEVPNSTLDHYTCLFKANKLHCFLGSDEQDTFFSTTQRHQILYEILVTTQYGPCRERDMGVDRLLSENVFTAAFPLHEGPYKARPEELVSGSLSQRQILFQYWASWGKWSKYQPLEHVRQYFGEKVAFYFAWLGFYTGWLLPAAVVGTVVFITGIFLMLHDVPSQEICGSGERYRMCPLCKTCPYWQLSEICSAFMAGRLFDHGGTVFFSIFMSLWGVLFLEFWKRTNASLALHWDCSEFEDIEERPRPQFTATAPMTITNPITGAEEPYFPKRRRLHRILAGSMVIIMMIAVVVMFLVSVILYRAVVAILLSNSGSLWFAASASRIASITSSVVNLIFILILSKIYISLAHFLTKWEMHRTQTKYEDAFTFKVFVFQFVTLYSSPIYIAFFKGKFIGFPGNYLSFLGVRNEECSPGGCLIELAQELLVIMVGKQIINNVQEVAIPKLSRWWRKQKLLSAKAVGEEGESVLAEWAPWVMDHQLLAFKGLFDEYLEMVGEEGESVLAEWAPWVMDHQLLAFKGLFDEYLEMVLQFGFITIFVAGRPVAERAQGIGIWFSILEAITHLAVISNVRWAGVAERAQGIGIWFSILEAITHLAVISNAFLIAFTSDFLPRVYYGYVQDSSLHGYVNFTLAHAPREFVLQSNTTCRYRAFRDRDGNLTLMYWQLLAVRLGFIIAFEHLVFSISRVIAWLVPDIPEAVEVKVKRERYLAKEALAENKVLLERWETRNKASTTDLTTSRDWETEQLGSS